jgi:ATP-dependent DNA helicase RecG
LIEESDNLELENAVNTFNELTELLAPIKVGLVHGRLKTQEKATAMREFQAGIIQVLVATTVIEVGVDVPNASIMVIEHGERMGLSQLHQLRGRVGRGSVDSQCVLLYQNPLGEVAKQRLKAIYENTDGFKIAHEDLLIRGPGEILGPRQSGLPQLRFANLEEDMPILAEAKIAAISLLEQNSDLANNYSKLWFSGKEHFMGT